MPSLDDIAKKLTSLAQLNLTSGYTRAYKTGKLYDNIGSYNTPNRVLGKTKLGKKRLSKTKKLDTLEFDLTYNPPGATYGKYWNSPYGTRKGTTATIKKRYPQHFDYASKALKDPEIKASIKAYAKALGVQVATELRESFRKK
jgi:hypothetical protein